MSGPFGLTRGDRVLVVAPHPDDETLGAGGTISRLSACGVEVDVLAVTTGPLPQWNGTSEPTTRQAEFRAACAALGVTAAVLPWADEEHHMRLDQTAQLDLVRLIEAGPAASLTASKPTALLLPFLDSFNQDHRAVAQATFTAARPHGRYGKHVPRIVLGYLGIEERWSPAQPSRPVLVDTTGHWDAKATALGCYGTQLRGDGHPRSADRIHSVDAATGSLAGVDLAESFVCYRWRC